MNIASIAGVTSTTTNIEATRAFYHGLGCRVDKVNDKGLSVLVNWFWIRFRLVDNEEPSPTAVNMKVDSVDEFYSYAQEQALTVVAKPADTTWGVREFTIADPDGLKVTLFEKMK